MGVIRPARRADAERLRIIERIAGARFRQVGMAEIAAAEPMSAEVLVDYAEAGRSWVAAGDLDRAVGYVVVDVIDGSAHIEQICVEPDQQGRGPRERFSTRFSAGRSTRA
jgi:ribosomal protein S18 acetylase RimI-like enzyme